MDCLEKGRVSEKMTPYLYSYSPEGPNIDARRKPTEKPRRLSK